MTNYAAADVQGEWEFKILRSNTAAFRKREEFDKACAEESAAGWVLLEKFDNQRLRFKRPISARAGDSALEIDPYRTEYGITSASMVIVVLAVILGISFLIIAGVIGIAMLFDPPRAAPKLPPMPAIAKPAPEVPKLQQPVR